MRFQNNLSVIHYNPSDSDPGFSLHRQIQKELSAGRNVMLLCDSPIVRRIMRIAFASLGLPQQPGRFAIVVSDTAGFADMIPAALVERIHIFPNADDAVDWLVPSAGNANETLIYASLN